jgi:hypothetical protein
MILHRPQGDTDRSICTVGRVDPQNRWSRVFGTTDDFLSNGETNKKRLAPLSICISG